MKKRKCIVCGFIYDEAKGLPEEGIVPGTRWQDIPADWACAANRGIKVMPLPVVHVQRRLARQGMRRGDRQ